MIDSRIRMMKVLASSRIRFEIFEFMLGDKVDYESKLFSQPRHHHPKNTVFKRGWGVFRR